MRIRCCQKLYFTWSRHVYYLRQVGSPRCRLSLAGPLYKPFYNQNPHVCQQQGFSNGPRWDRLQDSIRDVTEIEIGDEDDDDDGYDTDDFDRSVRLDTEDLNAGFDRAVGRLSEEQQMRCSQTPNTPKNSRVLRVSIIGSPNSGKSTLINSLMGWKLNGVSTKVHTTEKNVFSIYTRGNTQIVFIDTPGVMSSEARIRHHCTVEMEKAPENSVVDADIIGVIIDCADRWERKFHEKVLQILHDNADKPSFLILNKTDLLKHSAVTLSVTRQLTDGVVGGKSFGKTNFKRRNETVPENMWRDDQEFEKLFSNLEQTYGRLDFPFANEKKVREAVAPSQTYKDQEATQSSMNSTALTLPIKLEEDSYQKAFLEEILSRQTADCDTSALDEESMSVMDDTNISGTWIKKFEERKKRNLEFKLKNYWTHFESVFPVSALNGDGIGYIVEFLQKKAKPSAWLYHSSVVTNQDPAEIAKMCVRQALLDHVDGYVPYTVDVNVAFWEVTENNRLDIVIEVVVKNAYEMNFLFGKQASSDSMSLDPRRHHRQTTDPYVHRPEEQFIKPSSIITKIASHAKQALLDAFRCEIKFQLAIRLDKTIKKEKGGKQKKVIKRFL